jgi:RNA polymerase sigma-70 factor (ECF subfamily)
MTKSRICSGHWADFVREKHLACYTGNGFCVGTGKNKFMPPRKCEICGAELPEKLFDRAWACTLLDRVLARLRAEQVAEGEAKLFEALKPALMGDLAPSSYTQIARNFGTTEMALSMAVHRLRRRFGKMLREEIASMVASPQEVEEEIAYLLGALR